MAKLMTHIPENLGRKLKAYYKCLIIGKSTDQSYDPFQAKIDSGIPKYRIIFAWLSFAA
jgi:hypothetical protein